MVTFNVKNILDEVRANADQRNTDLSQNSEEFLTDSEFLAIINTALEHLYSKIISWNENYFLASQDVTIQNQQVSLDNLPVEKLRMLKVKGEERYFPIKPLSLRQSSRYRRVGQDGKVIELYYTKGFVPLATTTTIATLNYPVGSSAYLVYYASAQAVQIELQQEWADYAQMKLQTIEDVVRHRDSGGPKKITPVSKLYADRCFEYYDDPLYYVLFDNHIRFFSDRSFYNYGFF